MTWRVAVSQWQLLCHLNVFVCGLIDGKMSFVDFFKWKVRVKKRTYGTSTHTRIHSFVVFPLKKKIIDWARHFTGNQCWFSNKCTYRNNVMYVGLSTKTCVFTLRIFRNVECVWLIFIFTFTCVFFFHFVWFFQSFAQIARMHVFNVWFFFSLLCSS